MTTVDETVEQVAESQVLHCSMASHPERQHRHYVNPGVPGRPLWANLNGEVPDFTQIPGIFDKSVPEVDDEEPEDEPPFEFTRGTYLEVASDRAHATPFMEGRLVIVERVVGPDEVAVRGADGADSGGWRLQRQHVRPYVRPAVGETWVVTSNRPAGAMLDEGDEVTITVVHEGYVRCIRTTRENGTWSVPFAHLRRVEQPEAEEAEAEPSQVVNVEDPRTPEEIRTALGAQELTVDEHGDSSRLLTRLIDALRARDEAVAVRDTARAERSSWRERLIERSHEVAEDNEWCEVFDAGMERLGLPPRHPDPEQETITVRATAVIRLNPDDDDIRAAIESAGGSTDGITHIYDDETVIKFDIPIETEVTVDEDECGCDAVDDWEDFVPEWAKTGQFEYTDYEEVTCPND